MKNPENKMPDYENPPVSEVALSMQFESLSKLRTPHIGLIWRKYQERLKPLKRIEEQPPLKQYFELFGDERLVYHRIEITNLQRVPRCILFNETEDELVQIQQDRFIHNWRRKDPADPYPRYENIKKDFLEDLKIFTNFLNDYHIGALKPNQCEVTYVNPILQKDKFTSADNLQNAITLLKSENKYSDSFLPELDSINMDLHYIIPPNRGRLHITIKPALGINDKYAYLLVLTARGKPTKDNIDGVLEFMGIGHEWIVRGFTSITTSLMHEEWRKK